MMYFERWKVWLITIVCIWGVAYSAPNLMSDAMKAKFAEMSSWLPNKSVSLGLDLQGGAHLLMQVDMDYAVKNRLNDMSEAAKRDLLKERIGYVGLRIEGESVLFQLRAQDDETRSKALKIARKLYEGVEADISDDGLITATLSPMAVTEIKTQTLNQSIEIVRRRIDETGTREPAIQRQGYERILVQLPGVDDPERIKQLLVKTASMTFHLVDENSSEPGARLSPSSIMYPMKENPQIQLAVKKRAELQGERLVDAQPSFEDGMPVVTFRFDRIGTDKFCRITRENQHKRFAVVLDKEIVTAPSINEPICGGAGRISGRFTVQETVDTSLLLRAGALPAPLTFMEERTIGPSLGADSVESGKVASLMGMCFVLVFMIAVYGLFGIFANIALLVNVALIFAVLSVLQATLTLPGIAGIVLTIGMAVDANVLIFERIREELRNGRSILSSVETGYGHAMSSIIDANLTTLIAALMLFSFGTGPIKGFAVTLWVGILTSMFSAILLTRLMVVMWLKAKKPQTLPI